MLPDRKLLVIAIILSSIFVVDNTIKYLTTPPDLHYAAYDGDEIGHMAAQKSYIWGFKSSWLASEDTVFHNLSQGANFVMAFFGIFHLLFRLDMRILFLITKFILALSYFIVGYHIINYFTKDKKQQESANLLFLFVGGLGGIVYLIIKFFIDTNPNPDKSLFIMGSYFTAIAGQLYSVISLIAGHGSIYFLLKNKQKLSAFFLAVSIISYPIFGNIFVLFAVLHFLIYRKFNRYLPLSLVSYTPWIILYLQKPEYFTEYLSTSSAYTNIFVFLIYGGFTLLFSVYAYYNLINSCFRKRKITKDEIFLFAWGFVVVALSIMPPTRFITTPPRYLHMLFLPLSIIAIKGIFDFSRRYKIIRTDLIISIILILSIPTLIVYYLFLVKPAGVYIYNDEYSALMFLKEQPQGNVLSTRWPIGALIPSYAEKRSMLGSMTGNQDIPLIEEVNEFFSGKNITKQKEILDKYKITYVFYGPRELNITKNFNPTALQMVRIFENNTTTIYRYQGSSQ